MQASAMAFVLLLAFTAFWCTTEARKAIAPAQVLDGKCKYKNATIENGGTFTSGEPCQSWTCVAQQSAVIIAGCPIVVAGPGCKLEVGAGAFPNCCKVEICP
ncbi:unnamed protein product [Ixodes persulcatus]